MEKKILIPTEIKHLFSQEYLDFDLALKLFQSETPELKQFFSQLMPLIKAYLETEFPIVKMLNIF